MKKLFTLCFLTTLFLQAKAQQGYVLTGLNLMQNTATTRCDTVVNLSFWAQSAANNAQANNTLPFILSGNNFVPSQFQFAVSWGDGTTSNYNGGVSNTGVVIPVQPSPQHTFPGPGIYTIVVAALNFANQTTAVDTVVMTLGSCQLPIYSLIQVDCNNDGVIDSSLNNVPVPLVITGSGQTYSGNLQNNFYNFTGIEPGLYTLSIDPSWLAANNYTIDNIQGPQVLATGSGAQTLIITLNCGNGGGNNGPMCVNGQVYCDQNNDGQFNGNDTPISNAPVVVNFGNGSVVVYTNQQGNYTASYNGAANGMALVSLNANWMNQHGYTANMVLDTVMNLPCNAGAAPPNVSFPVQCGGNNGNPNCYSGYVFCDANGNGVMNAGELPILNAPVTLSANPPNNINSVIVYTDSTGYFTYCGALSNTNYVLANINVNYLNNLGYTANFGIVTIPANQTGAFPINCGAGAGNGCTNLWTTVTPWIGYYQNSTASIKLNWGNYGPIPSGAYTLTLNFPAGVTVNTASINTPGYTLAGNTLTWNLPNLGVGANNTDIITFNIPGGLINGANHYFTSSISMSGNIQDCNMQNNNGTLLQVLGNSYDPNDKTVIRPAIYIGNGIFASDEIETGTQDILTYTIRFQNTGNAPAQNVVVVDTLDSELDFTTFDLVYSSHNLEVVDMGNGVLHFEFNGIWLPDSTTNEPQSHGEFMYRIQEKPNNANLSEITNTAYIFFDWNPAIVTNTTYNVNTWVEGVEELSNNVKLYPNPSNTYFSVDAKAPFEYHLVDLSGRTVLQGSATSAEKIALQSLMSGPYLLKVRIGDETICTKLIKE
jgi:uncharacterized repeat protein (TIGR01451 family)